MKNGKEKWRIPLPSLPPDFLLLACLVAGVLLLGAGYFAPLAAWLKTFCFVAATLLAGYDVVLDAILKLAKDRDFDENLLVVIAVILAFLIGKHAEAAAVMVFFRTAGYIEDRIIERHTNTIEGILDQRPDVVNAIVNGAIVQKAVGKVKAGDILSVAPGERLALDAVVVSGVSEIDTLPLTGDSVSMHVSYGSTLPSGCINKSGILNVRVTEEFDRSTVTRLLKFIEATESKKSDQEKKISRFAQIFTPAVVGAAVLIGILIPLIGGLPIVPWLSRAVSFLLVSSPSALLISVPLTYFAGIGCAARKGILMRGASVADTLAQTTSVVFNKTGTLTYGSYQVLAVRPNGMTVERLLTLAAYAEAKSEHPIARAIVTAAGMEPDLLRIENFREIRGRGTEASIGGITISAGNAMFMAERGVLPEISEDEASAVFITAGGRYAGCILLSDTLRPDSKKAIKELHDIGIDRIAVFTGDKKEAAADTAEQLGITEVYAEFSPEEKAERVKGLTEMQLPGDKLVYIGDGLTESEALRAADVGVSLGGIQSDEALAAADLIIMTDEPSKIVPAIKLTRETKEIVRQNILISLILKGLILLFIVIGLVGMWLAVLVDAAVVVVVLMNAMRAFRMRSGEIKKALADIKRRRMMDVAADNAAESSIQE